jgi:hypothetical protein
MGLSFTTAPGPRQCSHSQARVPRDSWSHFALSDWRLPQPGGPGLRIYIPHEWGGPVIPPGTGLPFRHLLRLAKLRWRYSTPPPYVYEPERTSFNWLSESESDSYITTDGQSASLSWNKAPIWGLRPDFYYCQTVAGLLMWGALPDERTGLSFTIYADPLQLSHSWVWVPWDWLFQTVLLITSRHGPSGKYRFQ